MLAAFALLLVLQVLARPLLPIDETRYLDVAWEMQLTGDWVQLTRNFEAYSHKPPLLFWLINLVWLATGVSEFAARLVGPACAVVAAALTGALARVFWPIDRGVRTRSVLVLAGFSVFAIYGSATMFDALLTIAVLGGIWALWRIGLGDNGPWDWALFGLCLALGVYAKGPVILVHLAAPYLTLRYWAPNPPTVRRIVTGGLIALGLALALVALWLVPALIVGSDSYRQELLWTQSAARVAGGMAHDRPVWFLIAVLPLLLFPWFWTPRLWPALGEVLRTDGMARLCLIWAGSGLVLFSLISGKQVHYLIPEFPAVALLVARAMGSDRLRGPVFSLAPLLPALLGVGLLVLSSGLIPAKGDLLLLTPAIAVVAVGLLALAIAAIGWATPTMAGAAVSGIGLVLVLNALVAATGLYRGYDARPIAARLSAAEENGLAVIAMPYNAEFNFAGRLTSPVATPRSEAELRDWAASNPEGLIFGPVTALKTAPEATERYNGIDYGFWPTSVLSVQE